MGACAWQGDGSTRDGRRRRWCRIEYSRPERAADTGAQRGWRGARGGRGLASRSECFWGGAETTRRSKRLGEGGVGWGTDPEIGITVSEPRCSCGGRPHSPLSRVATARRRVRRVWRRAAQHRKRAAPADAAVAPREAGQAACKPKAAPKASGAQDGGAADARSCSRPVSTARCGCSSSGARVLERRGARVAPDALPGRAADDGSHRERPE